jgi:hypothetical protein
MITKVLAPIFFREVGVDAGEEMGREMVGKY